MFGLYLVHIHSAEVVMEGHDLLLQEDTAVLGARNVPFTQKCVECVCMHMHTHMASLSLSLPPPSLAFSFHFHHKLCKQHGDRRCTFQTQKLSICLDETAVILELSKRGRNGSSIPASISWYPSTLDLQIIVYSNGIHTHKQSASVEFVTKVFSIFRRGLST